MNYYPAHAYHNKNIALDNNCSGFINSDTQYARVNLQNFLEVILTFGCYDVLVDGGIREQCESLFVFWCHYLGIIAIRIVLVTWLSTNEIRRLN